jgi:hypothetical protein
MSRALAVAIVLALAADASAERMPWYRGFYTRVGIRDAFGAQEPFHAWAAFAFGIGYRYTRGLWGIDASVLNVQFDPEEGLHTAARIVPYVNVERWIAADAWLGAGISVGWLKGTVDQAIAKRRGEGLQGEVIAGVELPRQLRVRLFVQATLTLPFYNLYDIYKSRDSELYVYAFEGALGVRF